MYLARRRIAGRWQYTLRESYRSGAHLLFREVFDLGPAPERFIVYPGGNAFYVDPTLEEALRARGTDPSSAELETIFWPFVAPTSATNSSPSGAGRRSPRAGDPGPGSSPAGGCTCSTSAHPLSQDRPDGAALLGPSAGLRHARMLQDKSRDEIEQGFMRDGGRAPAAGDKDLRLSRSSICSSTSTSVLPVKPPSFSTGMTSTAVSVRRSASSRTTPGSGPGCKPEGVCNDYLVRYVMMYFDHDYDVAFPGRGLSTGLHEPAPRVPSARLGAASMEEMAAVFAAEPRGAQEDDPPRAQRASTAAGPRSCTRTRAATTSASCD